MKHYPLGSPMPIMVRIVGIILQLAGLYALLTMPLQGLFVLVIGCIATYQWQGVDVDLVGRRFRFYRNFMGIKSGKWVELEKFPYVSIIKRQTSQRVYGMLATSYDHEKKFYSVILMDEQHRTKYVLKNVEGNDQVLVEAEQISKDIGRELVKFNPPVSASRMSKRR